MSMEKETPLEDTNPEFAFQDYAVLSETETSSNKSGIRVYELDTGRPVNEKGILHAGHPQVFDVIAMDEHNQPIQRGEYERTNMVQMCAVPTREAAPKNSPTVPVVKLQWLFRFGLGT